jgi:hypothetical protein
MTYTIDKKFEIHYSNFSTISTNGHGCKEAKILHKWLYSLNNNMSKWMFCNNQIAITSYILPCYNYSTIIRVYLVYKYFNRVETQMNQCMDIENLRKTTQCLIQEGVDEEYIPYISDLRKIELYPKYLWHEQKINNRNLSEKAIDSLKLIRNRFLTKYQIGNVFESAKSMKELIELQVILNSKFTEYYRLIQEVFV